MANASPNNLEHAAAKLHELSKALRATAGKGCIVKFYDGESSEAYGFELKEDRADALLSHLRSDLIESLRAFGVIVREDM